MAKLLHLSRPSKRAGSAVRTWWALRCQKRRRQRAGGVSAVPAAPTNLVVTDNAGVLLELSWSDLAADMQGFRVYRNVDGAGYILWQTLDAVSNGAEDADVAIGHVYSYYVAAFNAAGESAPSNEVQVVAGA